MHSAINEHLCQLELRIAQNPCISPDCCLDWESLAARLKKGEKFIEWPKARFETSSGAWRLWEDSPTGDCFWQHIPDPRARRAEELECGIRVDGTGRYFPATWTNLMRLKNLVQEHDPGSTIFPTVTERLGRSTIGVGARFTTMHWPAVEWTMSVLGIGLTANQNSIPRELVYDVNVMLAGKLDTVAFPFIGTNVPEGHQGQSVEGMSHGAVLSKLKYGFHTRRIAWLFNADHQPIGGKYDEREDALVRGSLLASYITFDLSPELARNQPAAWDDIPPDLVRQTRHRVAAAGIVLAETDFQKLLRTVWPALEKMQRRDRKYAAARAAAFTTGTGRRYLRELSIDELPGLTTPETTAVMLALCELLGVPVNFIAPAFGFQKNTPYPDNAALAELVTRQWRVCERFGVSMGFHSGSGKSAENYEVLGRITGGALEIKTSGRYTYEMGVALSNSHDPSDQLLWRQWYEFTLAVAVNAAFSTDPTEQQTARLFISTALGGSAAGKEITPPLVFASRQTCRAALEALPPSPDHMFFAEYNFLFVLAAGGQAEKSAWGDHSLAGYRQRARFYSISPEARLLYAQRVAGYLLFLVEKTGLVSALHCSRAKRLLDGYRRYEDLLADIGYPHTI